MTRDELKDLLQELERVVPGVDGWGYSVKECAICGGSSYPHNPKCKLAKAIAWLEDDGNEGAIHLGGICLEGWLLR